MTATGMPQKTRVALVEDHALLAEALLVSLAPEGFEVKGNKSSMKFHAPSSPWYDRTNAEVWFRTAEAAEKAGSTQGWTYTMFEEVFNQGYPHELKHFIDCVRHGGRPLVTGEDGRAVL